MNKSVKTSEIYVVSCIVCVHCIHMDRPEVSSPSHHFMAIWYSLDSRCRPKPVEGTTDSQEEE